MIQIDTTSNEESRKWTEQEKSGREFLNTDFKKPKIYTENYPTKLTKNYPLILGCSEFSEHEI